MKKFFKRLGALTLAAVLAVTMVPNTDTKAYADNKKEVTGYTGMELITMFSMGFNIGNTLDATGGNKTDIVSQEKSWGNPAITKEFIHGLKEAGFTIVRVPITWQKHVSSDSNNTIDKEWLEHIKQIVDWCYEEDLFVVINIHHDDTWLNVKNIATDYKNIGKKLSNIWSQIADYFADYDQRLIFESMNEPRAKGTDYEWTGSADGYAAINYLNQQFVNAVRGNGKGHNSERLLSIPGYAATNSHEGLMAITIPEWKGKQAENVMVAVHCYSPYNFCLSDNQSTFDPNSLADTSDIKRMFNDIKSLFLDKGIPVYLGECGVTRQGDNFDERAEYLDYFGNLCRQYGVPACIWDNGVDGKSGGENHSYIKRRDGSVLYPELVKAFVYGIPVNEKELDDLVVDFEPQKIDGVTTAKSPSDLGFSPASIRGKMKINHTEGVNMGYSAMVDNGVKEASAYLDITDFQGRMVKITAYLMAEEADIIKVGLRYNGTMHEYSTVQFNTAEVWKGVGFAEELPFADKLELYFVGEDGKTYYIDDIKVEKVDSIAGITFDFGNQDEEAVVEEPAVTDTPASTSQDTQTSVSTSQTSTPSETETPATGNGVATILMWVCIGVAALAIIVVLVSVVFKKKDK